MRYDPRHVALKQSRSQGSAHIPIVSLSPCLLVSLSPCLPRPRRQGIVLLAVLVVVVMLTLAAYQFSELMMAEYRAADSYTRSAQAKAMANSGIHYAAAALSNADNLANLLNSNPFDNPGVFQGVLVQPHEHPRFQGRFCLIAAIDPDDPAASGQGYRFGVLDESGKINLNAVMRLDSSGQVLHDMLMTLPNMTEDIANAIIDWIDADEEARPNSAEIEYYSTLPTPYRTKNGPLDSLEELLLVKGMTPQLLFGNDRNRNGILEPDEDDGSGIVNQGWSSYLTVLSREQNVDSEGNPRIYINDPDLTTLAESLTTALGEDLANYILAYRLYGSGSGGQSGGGGGSSGSGSGSGGQAGGSGSGGGGGRGGSQRLSRSSLNLQGGQPRSISSLYELINSSVTISSSSSQTMVSQSGRDTVVVTTQEQTSVTYSSPLNDAGQLEQLLPVLLDKVTTVRGNEIPARVNINTAPAAVLAALPGLTEADVQMILSMRPDPADTDPPDPIFETPAWLLTDANLQPQTLRTLERYITARTQVYRVQALGYFDGGGPTARIEAVIDTNGGRPRVVYYRDLTELGKGFDLQR